ncbi:MAG: GspH/FimT family pseudopilin [Steroidobacteraceae bacterium]
MTSIGRFRPSRQEGFTLLELVITMSIVAILLAIAIPSYKYVTTANRMSGEINGALGDMQFARTEAIKEGQAVSVCVSTDGATCAISDQWSSGWIVYSGSGAQPANQSAVLRVQAAFPAGVNADSLLPATGNTSAIQFNQEGFAVGLPGSVVLQLHDPTDNSTYTRCLQVTIVGSLSTLNYDGVTCK